MVESLKSKQQKSRRVNLGGCFESGLVLLGVVGGSIAMFIPRVETVIFGAAALAGATAIALRKWSPTNKS